MTTRFSYPDLKELVQEKGAASAIRGYEFRLYDLTVGFGKRDKTVVELGTETGWSTRALLAAVNDSGGHLYSVDILDFGGILKGEPNWTFILGTSLEVAKTWHRKVDHLFIDTVHTFNNTFAELRTWYPFISERGVISLHDTEYGEDNFGVKRAVEEFLRTHPELSFENDTTGHGLHSGKIGRGVYGLGILRRKENA